MYMFKEKLSDSLKRSLVEYCYDIIGCMHDTYKELSPGLPEPIFQEALQISLFDAGYKDAVREYHHYPKFRNKKLSSHIQVDIMVPKQGRNIVIECKSITKLGDRERLQLFGYLRVTKFPVGILVNFGSFPKAEIERYYYNHKSNTIEAF
ncbi:MAG: GxxExxY protein [Clostridia bacterium]|nr:GxxExxY protein [Clostridia bacterium]